MTNQISEVPTEAADEIARLEDALRSCLHWARHPKDGDEIGRRIRLNAIQDVCMFALRLPSEPETPK